MKLHNLADKLRQKVLEGLGECDVVVHAVITLYNHDIENIKVKRDSFDDQTVIVLEIWKENKR